jgi:phage/plasmid-like protein (TIGR03299 family)
MPAYFTEGYFVEHTAWHKLGTVLANPPETREEAIVLAGHDYNVTAAPLFARYNGPDDAPTYVEVPGWRQLIATSNGDRRSPVHGNLLHIAKDSYAVIQNTVAYEFADALIDLGFTRWAGITIRDGAECALTFKLNEPIVITGDTSATLPYLVLSWAHDGSGALRGRSTSIRAECWNTVSAGEAEGKRLGTDFSIRHTQKWASRVEDAKRAILGVRADIETYRNVMEEFAMQEVKTWNRDLFASAVVLDQKVASVPRFKADVAKGAYSARVQGNVERAKASLLALFNGPTIPEEHRNTAYGLHMAGVEYLDHIRRSNSEATHVGRSLLRDEPAKARLTPLIREILAKA